MNGLWLKVRIWTKVVVFVLVFVYLLCFVYWNTNNTAKFWYWRKREPETGTLFLVLFSFLAGVVTTVLVRAIFRTIRQIRDSRQRGRTERLEREVADMKAKAAMLQTKGNGPAAHASTGG
jgi:uncharacterized integral membrane protein